MEPPSPPRQPDYGRQRQHRPARGSGRHSGRASSGRSPNRTRSSSVASGATYRLTVLPSYRPTVRTVLPAYPRNSTPSCSPEAVDDGGRRDLVSDRGYAGDGHAAGRADRDGNQQPEHHRELEGRRSEQTGSRSRPGFRWLNTGGPPFGASPAGRRVRARAAHRRRRDARPRARPPSARGICCVDDVGAARTRPTGIAAEALEVLNAQSGPVRMTRSTRKCPPTRLIAQAVAWFVRSGESNTG